MSHFSFREGLLHAEAIPVELLARAYGTPTYIYSRAALEENYRAYAGAMGSDDLVCYAVKANSSLAVLNVLARCGAGFDIVSAGELERVLLAGGDAGKVVFSGVAKTAAEMQRALEAGIRCFNVESAAELERLNEVALSMGKKAPVSIRVNPDVDASTHPYISTGLRENKFGIHIESVFNVYRRAAELPGIRIEGIDCHIGSQLTKLSPFLDAVDRVLGIIDQLAAIGITLHHIDMGGGLGVRYREETPPTPREYVQGLRQKLKEHNLTLIIEPGRSIAANAGILITSVEYLKSSGEKNFAIIDAAMNDMIRPSLYQAWMEISRIAEGPGTCARYDLVGPVCETGDFLGKDRDLCLAAGDILAMFCAGAYGFSMASNYNSRGRAAEIMVDGTKHFLVRERETISDLVRGESVLP